jgi:hypothetical protein
MLRTFERRILRVICGPTEDNGIWRARYSNELYRVYHEADTVKVVKIGRLMWLGQVCRMQEMDHYRKVTVLKPEGTRRET